MKHLKPKRRHGTLFIVSAPSGAGKTTVIEKVLAKDQQLVRSISMTTRTPRNGERNGRDYFFISKAGFRNQIRRRALLEWARVFDQYYGTPKRPVENYLAEGRDVILVIDVQGARKVLKTRRAASIFMKPPSLRELGRRLAGRRSDRPAEQRRRLLEARKEMAQARFYDKVIVNIRIQRTVREILRFIQRVRKSWYP